MPFCFMRHPMSRPALVFVASLMICGTALASPGPDRSALSYEENVLINTACASTRPKGDSAYYACVSKQVAALQAHPAPDRSGLTAAQNKAVEERCQYLRRSGVAQYYDCISQAMAGPAPSAEENPGDGLAPNFVEVFTHGTTGTDQPKSQVTPASAATVPLPGAVLAKRPDNVRKQALDPQELFKTLQRSIYVVAATATLDD